MFWGTQHCRSSWACPVCSTRNMATYATNIYCAIEALRHQNIYGFMLTMTIPHTRMMKCEQAYQILLKTWKDFAHHGNTSKRNATDPFAKFCSEMQCKYRIRACEFTWGESNGWHPHFHCIFFVPKANLQKVLDYQERLAARWTKLARKNTLAILSEDKRFHDPKRYVELMYKRNLSDLTSFHISTDKKGRVKPISSSKYMCGWGADSELTGLEVKNAKKGHYTPFGLLEMAMRTDNAELRKKYVNLFKAYDSATIGTYRVRMSRNLKKIIIAFKKTQDYITAYKKKLESAHAEKGIMKLVTWFTSEQWYNILGCEKITNQPVRTEILRMARGPNAKNAIEKYLLTFGIDTRDNVANPPKKALLERMMNGAA